MSAWSVKTRSSPSRHCTGARFYAHTTAAIHDMSTSPPVAPRSPSSSKTAACAVSSSSELARGQRRRPKRSSPAAAAVVSRTGVSVRGGPLVVRTTCKHARNGGPGRRKNACKVQINTRMSTVPAKGSPLKVIATYFLLKSWQI